MRTKVTLVLIFLNVALFFFIFKFERNWRTEAATLEARKRVLGPEAADISAVEITNHTSGVTVSLTRDRETWLLKKPLDWPANPHAASAIVHELQLLENKTSFAVADLAQNKQSLADYGLEKPKLTVAFTSGGLVASGQTPPAPTTLEIGDATGDGKRLYVLSPDRRRVHVVNRSLLDTLTVPIEQLRADTLLNIRVFEARSLSLQTSGGGASGVRVRIRREGTRWNFETPIIARASKTAIELAINELNALQPKTFNPPTRPAAPPASAPVLRITLEGNNRHETLFIGEKVPAPAAPARAASPAAELREEEYYAQLENRDALFTVVMKSKLLEDLRTAQETLREKRFMEFDPANVTAVTIAAPIQPNQAPLTLQRLEAPTAQRREPEYSWQVVHRDDGGQVPQTLPAENAAVRRLLERLSLLTAEQLRGEGPFKSDAPTSADLEDWGFNRPIRQVTLTLTGNTPPLVLRLGTNVARSVTYARVGTATEPGASIYVVSSDILGALEMTATAWRNRTVGEPLPDNARITRLKLVDLAEKQTLAEIEFGANGEPTTPPRDPKAVAAVVAGLRTLRAKEFVPGGFAERVGIANDAPWRFQLEATILSPGAPGAEPTRTMSLLLTERLGGVQQYAGARELDTIFSLEQPLVDALWSLAYGGRDPGPPDQRKK